MSTADTSGAASDDSGAADARPDDAARSAEEAPRTKKDQIVALFLSGMRDVQDIAVVTGAKPSYVGAVLQEADLNTEYFDLYTSTSHPMNVYSKFFAGKLGYRDEARAQESVDLIDRMYRQFAIAEDRAGQHHALVMALTMFDRARWSGKEREADVFRAWLLDHIRRDEREPSNGANESL